MADDDGINICWEDRTKPIMIIDQNGVAKIRDTVTGKMVRVSLTQEELVRLKAAEGPYDVVGALLIVILRLSRLN